MLTLLVATNFPPINSETVLVAAGVLNPTTTASTRDNFGSLGSASSAGAFTLSTVQLGGAAPFATLCNVSFTGGGKTISAKLAGIAECCISLNKCKSIGPC